MSNATILLARRSIRARFGRLIAIAIAIVAGVSFVVGSFVLAASMRAGFDSLFTAGYEYTDLQVRSSLEFGTVDEFNQRDPVPADLVDDVAAVEGVEIARGLIQRTALVLDNDREPITGGGAPTFGFSWAGPEADPAVPLLAGSVPSGPEEFALDKATADDNNLSLGDELDVVTPTGLRTFTLVGLAGLGDTDGFGGATAAMFDPETAAIVLDAEGEVDTIEIGVASGVDVDDVEARVAAMLPAGIEVVDRDTVIEEANDAVGEFIDIFGTGLLIFAFITAFVSAFLINNVFAITIGQRLRELALLRAVGGAGRQVRRLIVSEALIMSLIATALGVFGGLGVARLMLGIFNSVGVGFPNFPLKLEPIAVVMALLVGVGITVAAVTIPARRAAKIPPVAAMRPELGFDALSTKRLVAGVVTVSAGAVMFLVGLFARPGGTAGLIALAGGGALLLFLGTASVSSTIAKPVTSMIGWPVHRVYGASGQLARENAGRAPRRTSATAAALMIGVALVSACAVFASSLRDTIKRVFDSGVLAEYVVTGEGFTLLPPLLVDELAELDEVGAITGVRCTNAIIEDGTKEVCAGSASALPLVLDVGLVEGAMDLDGAILVHEDPAADLDLAVGDTLTLQFTNGEERDLPVTGIYEDSFLAGNWLVSTETLDDVLSSPPMIFFGAVKLADGVSDEQFVAAAEPVMDGFPQATLQTASEFADDGASQVDQLLIVITVLLGLSIIIAVLGISITLGLAVFERTREIGLMRAVGMTKRQTRRMVRWEAIIVSTFGAIVGIVLGTGLGVALTAAVPIIDDISFNPTIIVIILVGAVIAGFVAALYPSYKASRMDVLEAIATE